jgi:hypothetical protein
VAALTAQQLFSRPWLGRSLLQCRINLLIDATGSTWNRQPDQQSRAQRALAAASIYVAKPFKHGNQPGLNSAAEGSTRHIYANSIIDE